MCRVVRHGGRRTLVHPTCRQTHVVLRSPATKFPNASKVSEPTRGVTSCNFITLLKLHQLSYYFYIFLRQWHITIRHPDTRVKHRAYGHSVASLLNPRGVATVRGKYSLTVARHVTVVVAVPSTVHYPANYKIKIYY
jgi:hypothetical protein